VISACVSARRFLDRHRRAVPFYILNVGAHISWDFHRKTAQGRNELAHGPAPSPVTRRANTRPITRPYAESRGLTAVPNRQAPAVCHGSTKGQISGRCRSYLPMRISALIADQIPETSPKKSRSRRRILPIFGGRDPECASPRNGDGASGCQRRLVSPCIGEAFGFANGCRAVWPKDRKQLRA